MQPRSRITVFFWGFALAVGLGSAAAIGSQGGPWPFAVDEESAAVLVVITGDGSGIQRLREAVPADRLLVDHPEGFAVRGGRVVAANADAVGPILMSAGWDDARLEIFTPGRPSGQRAGGPVEAEVSARIRLLMDKPELSLLESRELLRWMDKQP